MNARVTYRPLLAEPQEAAGPENQSMGHFKRFEQISDVIAVLGFFLSKGSFDSNVVTVARRRFPLKKLACLSSGTLNCV